LILKNEILEGQIFKVENKMEIDSNSLKFEVVNCNN